jgi:hypothetical protein
MTEILIKFGSFRIGAWKLFGDCNLEFGIYEGSSLICKVDLK